MKQRTVYWLPSIRGMVLLSALLMDRWPAYSLIYVALILLDIILFGRYTKKLFP